MPPKHPSLSTNLSLSSHAILEKMEKKIVQENEKWEGK
jgi:hypothetical protein